MSTAVGFDLTSLALDDDSLGAAHGSKVSYIVTEPGDDGQLSTVPSSDLDGQEAFSMKERLDELELYVCALHEDREVLKGQLRKLNTGCEALCRVVAGPAEHIKQLENQQDALNIQLERVETTKNELNTSIAGLSIKCGMQDQRLTEVHSALEQAIARVTELSERMDKEKEARKSAKSDDNERKESDESLSKIACLIQSLQDHASKQGTVLDEAKKRQRSTLAGLQQLERQHRDLLRRLNRYSPALDILLGKFDTSNMAPSRTITLKLGELQGLAAKSRSTLAVSTEVPADMSPVPEECDSPKVGDSVPVVNDAARPPVRSTARAVKSHCVRISRGASASPSVTSRAPATATRDSGNMPVQPRHIPADYSHVKATLDTRATARIRAKPAPEAAFGRRPVQARQPMRSPCPQPPQPSRIVSTARGRVSRSFESDSSDRPTGAASKPAGAAAQAGVPDYPWRRMRDPGGHAGMSAAAQASTPAGTELGSKLGVSRRGAMSAERASAERIATPRAGFATSVSPAAAMTRKTAKTPSSAKARTPTLSGVTRTGARKVAAEVARPKEGAPGRSAVSKQGAAKIAQGARRGAGLSIDVTAKSLDGAPARTATTPAGTRQRTPQPSKAPAASKSCISGAEPGTRGRAPKAATSVSRSMRTTSDSTDNVCGTARSRRSSLTADTATSRARAASLKTASAAKAGGRKVSSSGGVTESSVRRSGERSALGFARSTTPTACTKPSTATLAPAAGGRSVDDAMKTLHADGAAHKGDKAHSLEGAQPDKEAPAASITSAHNAMSALPHGRALPVSVEDMPLLSLSSSRAVSRAASCAGSAPGSPRGSYPASTMPRYSEVGCPPRDAPESLPSMHLEEDPQVTGAASVASTIAGGLPQSLPKGLSAPEPQLDNWESVLEDLEQGSVLRQLGASNDASHYWQASKSAFVSGSSSAHHAAALPQATTGEHGGGAAPGTSILQSSKQIHAGASTSAAHGTEGGAKNATPAISVYGEPATNREEQGVLKPLAAGSAQHACESGSVPGMAPDGQATGESTSSPELAKACNAAGASGAGGGWVPITTGTTPIAGASAAACPVAEKEITSSLDWLQKHSGQKENTLGPTRPGPMSPKGRERKLAPPLQIMPDDEYTIASQDSCRPERCASPVQPGSSKARSTMRTAASASSSDVVTLKGKRVEVLQSHPFEAALVNQEK